MSARHTVVMGVGSVLDDVDGVGDGVDEDDEGGRGGVGAGSWSS